MVILYIFSVVNKVARGKNASLCAMCDIVCVLVCHFGAYGLELFGAKSKSSVCLLKIFHCGYCVGHLGWYGVL